MNQVYNILNNPDLEFTVMRLMHDKLEGKSRFKLSIGRSWVEIELYASGDIFLSWPSGGEEVSLDPETYSEMEQLLRNAHEIGTKISSGAPGMSAWKLRGIHGYIRVRSRRGVEDDDLIELLKLSYAQYKAEAERSGVLPISRIDALVFWTLGWAKAQRDWDGNPLRLSNPDS